MVASPRWVGRHPRGAVTSSGQKAFYKLTSHTSKQQPFPCSAVDFKQHNAFFHLQLQIGQYFCGKKICCRLFSKAKAILFCIFKEHRKTEQPNRNKDIQIEPEKDHKGPEKQQAFQQHDSPAQYLQAVRRLLKKIRMLTTSMKSNGKLSVGSKHRVYELAKQVQPPSKSSGFARLTER